MALRRPEAKNPPTRAVGIHLDDCGAFRVVFAADVATRANVEVEFVIGLVENQRMGYVLIGKTHKTGHFGEDGALLVKAVRVLVFEAVYRIVVGDEKCSLVEGDAVGPVEVIGRFVHGVGATVAVLVGQG